MRQGETLRDDNGKWMGHISFDDGKVQCPHCHTHHEEPANDRWIRATEKNKRGYTRKKCLCGKTFGIAVCMVGGLTGFVIRTRRYHERRFKKRFEAFGKRSGYYRAGLVMLPWQTVSMP